jgi:E3 ubiquitin-protein ligase HERC4
MGTTVTQICCGRCECHVLTASAINFGNFLLGLFFRCHTLAFVPSKDRIYAFGLGGSGQLSTKSTANVNSPQLVIGPWEMSILSNNSIKDVKDLATETAEALSAIQSKRVVVRNIFCGGDQSFSLVCPYTVRAFL